MGLIRNLHGLLPVEKSEKLGWCDTLLTVLICTENYKNKFCAVLRSLEKMLATTSSWIQVRKTTLISTKLEELSHSGTGTVLSSERLTFMWREWKDYYWQAWFPQAVLIYLPVRNPGPHWPRNVIFLFYPFETGSPSVFFAFIFTFFHIFKIFVYRYFVSVCNSVSQCLVYMIRYLVD